MSCMQTLMAFRGSPVLSCWIDRYEVRAWVRDEETRRGDLAVVRGDRARKPAAAGLKRKVGHRRVVSGRGLRIARTSICICAAARWASALAPDCAPASTDRYCWTLAIVTYADRWGGERVTRTPMGSRTQLCGPMRGGVVRSTRSGPPRGVLRPLSFAESALTTPASNSNRSPAYSAAQREGNEEAAHPARAAARSESFFRNGEADRFETDQIRN